jgi:hypothetical protein
MIWPTCWIGGNTVEVVLVNGPGERAPVVFLHEGLGSVSQWSHRGRNWQAIRHATGSGVLYLRLWQSIQCATRRDAPPGRLYARRGLKVPWQPVPVPAKIELIPLGI